MGNRRARTWAGGRGEEGQDRNSTGVHGGDGAPDAAARQYLSLSIYLLWEKKKKIKNANSAAANFAQLHLDELPTSNQPTGRKA